MFHFHWQNFCGHYWLGRVLKLSIITFELAVVFAAWMTFIFPNYDITVKAQLVYGHCPSEPIIPQYEGNHLIAG